MVKLFLLRLGLRIHGSFLLHTFILCYLEWNNTNKTRYVLAEIIISEAAGHTSKTAQLSVPIRRTLSRKFHCAKFWLSPPDGILVDTFPGSLKSVRFIVVISQDWEFAQNYRWSWREECSASRQILKFVCTIPKNI